MFHDVPWFASHIFREPLPIWWGLAVHPKTGKKQVVAVVISMSCMQSMSSVPSCPARPVQVLFICDCGVIVFNVVCCQESHYLARKHWHNNCQQLVIGRTLARTSRCSIYMLKQDDLKGQLNDMNDFLQPVVHGFCFWFPMVEAGVLRSPGNKHCIVSHSPLKTGSLCWNASVLWFPKYYYYVPNCLIDPVRSQLWSKPVIEILHQNHGNKMCSRQSRQEGSAQRIFNHSILSCTRRRHKT